jgi:o-succinylbenzoate synthase
VTGGLVAASATRVRIPFRQPFETSIGTFHEHDAWIVRIRDAKGREGVGEASLAPGASDADQAGLAAAVRAVLEDPAAWLAGGDAGATDSASARAARAAFAGAAADREHHGTPGPGGHILVNATIATDDLDATVAAAEAAVGAGFVCLKLKAGGEGTSEELVERVAAVRAVVGDDIELRLDVNGWWDPATAEARLAAIAASRIAYVEQPIAPGDVAALARLRRLSAVDIAADESIATRSDAATILAAEAADILVVKPARVGGPHEARAIAAAAMDAGVGVTISTLLETGVGLTAAVRVAATLRGSDRARAHGLATAGLLADDLLATPLLAHDGRIAVPTAPITLDEAALARWAVDRTEATR